jgi:predicted ribosome quality control (RQC) complex YloA/Tae2 family protein
MRDADAKAILSLQARMERDFTSIRDGLIAIGERLERKRKKLSGSAKKLAAWAETSCSMRRRQVFNYLKVYKHRAVLIEAGSGITSLRAALRMLNQAPERIEAAAETERSAALRRDALARWKEKRALKPAQRAALREYWTQSIDRLANRIERYRQELKALETEPKKK